MSSLLEPETPAAPEIGTSMTITLLTARVGIFRRRRVVGVVFSFDPFDDFVPTTTWTSATAPAEPDRETGPDDKPGGGDPRRDPDGDEELAPSDPRREELVPA